MPAPSTVTPIQNLTLTEFEIEARQSGAMHSH